MQRLWLVKVCMKKRPVSHIPRTRDFLMSGLGCDAVEIVERRIWHTSVQSHKHDAFGVADLVAINNGEVWWIQVCSDSGLSSHKKKIESSENTPILLTASRIFIVCWKKVGARWRPRILEYTHKGEWNELK